MNTMMNRASTYRHVLAVAAERELDGCIDHVIGELSAGIEKKLLKNENSALIVIETGTPDTARHNQRLLRDKVKHARHVFPVVHLMPESVERYITSVCGFDRKLKDMFLRKNCNLGRQANLCSLVAASLNAPYLHCRTIAGRPAGAGSEHRTLLEKELSLFTGCSGEVGIVDASLTYATTAGSPKPGFQPPTGESPTNSCVNEHGRCIIPAPSRLPPATTSTTLIPPKNNSAYKNLFRYFAGPPHKETPGTEHYFFLLGKAAGIPVKTCATPAIGISAIRASLTSAGVTTAPDSLSTGRRQRRDCDVDDKNFGSSYALMFARYIDFTTVYSMLADFKPLLALSPTGYISDVLYALADKADTMADYRKSLLYSFADSIITPGNDRGRHAASAVKDAIPAILSANYRQVRSHAYLQKQWKKMVMHAACQTIPIGV